MNTDTGKVTGGTIFLLVLISALYLLVPLLYTVYFSGLSLLLKQLPAGISRPYSMTVSGYRNLNYIFYFLKILLAGGYITVLVLMLKKKYIFLLPVVLLSIDIIAAFAKYFSKLFFILPRIQKLYQNFPLLQKLNYSTANFLHLTTHREMIILLLAELLLPLILLIILLSSRRCRVKG